MLESRDAAGIAGKLYETRHQLPFLWNFHDCPAAVPRKGDLAPLTADAGAGTGAVQLDSRSALPTAGLGKR